MRSQTAGWFGIRHSAARAPQTVLIHDAEHLLTTPPVYVPGGAIFLFRPMQSVSRCTPMQSTFLMPRNAAATENFFGYFRERPSEIA